MFRMETLKKSSLARETKWVLAGNVSTMVFSTLFTFYSANKLGISSYGILSVLMSSVLILQELLSFRTWEAVIKIGTEKLQEGGEQLSKVFLSFVLFDFLLYLSVFLFVVVCNHLIEIFIIKQEGYSFEIFLYSLIVLFGFNKGTFSAFLRIFRRHEVNSLIILVSGFVRLLFGVIFLSFSPTIQSFLYANLLSVIISFVLYFVFIHKVSRQNEINLRFYDMKEWLSVINNSRNFLFTTYWVSTLKSFTTRGLVIIMSFFLSVEQIGVYKLFRDIISIFNLAITDTLYNIVYPRFAASVKNNIKQTYGLIKYSLLYGLVGIVIYSLVVYLLGEKMINVFFPNYLDVLTLLKLATIELILLIQPSWLMPLIMCLNMNKENLIARCINSLSLIIFVLILAGDLGLIGIELALIFSNFMYVIYLLIVAKRSFIIKSKQ